MKTKELIIRNDALLNREAWISERDGLLRIAKQINTVGCEDDLKVSGDLQSAISKHIKALDVERKKVTAPIDAIKREIMASEKELKKELAKELERVKNLNTAYATQQMRIERERIEKERQEAAEREAERQAKAEAEAKAQAEESAFGAAAQFAPVEDPEPEPEPKIELAKPKLENNRMVERWSLQIVDPQIVPREFCTPDEKLIRAWMNYQIKMGATPALDGVKFTSRVSVEAR